MANRIQYRRDTAANWTAANPVLASGEPGIETDTKKRKQGDGVTAWNSLAYLIDKASADAAYTAITSTHPFGPALNITPGSFRKWRKALANVRTGAASAKLLCAGDSTTWGLGSGTGPAKAYPQALASMLNSFYAPAVTGLAVPPSTFSTGSDTDARWSAGAGWTVSAQGFGTNAAWNAPASTATNLTFTPGINCDTFDIYYLKNTGLGTVTASIDGGAGTAINTSATAGWGKTTITAAAGSSHVLTLTPNGTNLYILGVDAYLSTTKAIRVGNAGVAGTTTGNWNNNTAGYSSINGFAAYAPDLTILMLGINDARAAVSLSTWQTNMQALITAAKATGDVMIMSVIPSDVNTPVPAGTTTLEASYQAATLALAQSNNCGYVDLFSRYVSYAQSNSDGYMFDQLHPNAVGYADMAQTVFNVLKTI